MAYNNIFYTIKDLDLLSRELHDFIQEVDSENYRMLQETENVGFYWNDDQYRKFSQYMKELSIEIENCEKRLSKSNDKLESFIFELLRDA